MLAQMAFGPMTDTQTYTHRHTKKSNGKKHSTFGLIIIKMFMTASCPN